MKSEVKTPQIIQDIKYPVLAKSRDSGLIVLFTDSISGTVVKESKDWGLGERCTGFNHISRWEILPPGTQVVLTQE